MGNIGFMVGHQNYIAHAALLVHSIIEHTRLAGDASICVMTPSHTGLELNLSTVSQMEYSVPEPYRTIPFIDKMLAAAAFEQTCDGRYLWMDVDSYFFQHPPFREDSALCVNPVDKRNIGDTYGGSRSRLWRILYEYFGLNESDVDACPLFTTASGECIYPYLNAGMVAARENRRLFQTVRNALYALLERPDIMEMLRESQLNAIFFHQAVFTCAVLSKYGLHEIKPLPRAVNYPLHLHDSHVAPVPLEELISIRYDDYFETHCVPAIWTEHFAASKDILHTTWYYR